MIQKDNVIRRNAGTACDGLSSAETGIHLDSVAAQNPFRHNQIHFFVIHSQNAPAAIGPYSQAIQAGNTVYVSGQLPIDPATGAMPEGIAAQATQSMKNIQAILAEAGMEMKDIVKTTILLADLAGFGEVNEVYGSFFTGDYPARACYQVARLPKDALVEIEAVAVK